MSCVKQSYAHLVHVEETKFPSMSRRTNRCWDHSSPSPTGWVDIIKSLLELRSKLCIRSHEPIQKSFKNPQDIHVTQRFFLNVTAWTFVLVSPRKVTSRGCCYHLIWMSGHTLAMWHVSVVIELDKNMEGIRNRGITYLGKSLKSGKSLWLD